VLAQLNAALGPGVVFSGSGSTLSMVGSATASVNAASTTTTATSLANGNKQLAVFTDGNSPYSGAITGTGSQMTGYAGRITVNPAVLSNPSSLSVYNTSPTTASGDTARSDFLYTQLTTGSFSYSPTTGLGTTASPFSGTITNYMQQFLSQQSNAASTATQLQQGQDVVVSTLQQKFNSVAGVSIDTEMSNLIALQNSYAANAHVMSVVQSMMTTLLQSV
jgi:flagellar hook-associated protein 1 FlgK